MRRLARDMRGQMTIELAVAFPVLLAVAVIAFNALQFFGLCALFDRVVDEEVRLHAISPNTGVTGFSACGAIERELQEFFQQEAPNCPVDLQISWQQAALDLDRFTATLDYHPTLFGLGLRQEIAGVSLPTLSHSTSIVVDCYKPGVFL